MLHKVRDLPVEARGVVETLIGHRLREDETFSIRPVRLQKAGAEARLAGEVADRLERYFAEIDRQHPTVSESAAEGARSVRPGYRDGEEP